MQATQPDTISHLIRTVCIPEFLAKAPKWTTHLALTTDLKTFIARLCDIAGIRNKFDEKEPQSEIEDRYAKFKKDVRRECDNFITAIKQFELVTTNELEELERLMEEQM